jgi:hypothetical protein
METTESSPTTAYILVPMRSLARLENDISGSYASKYWVIAQIYPQFKQQID